MSETYIHDLKQTRSTWVTLNVRVLKIMPDQVVNGLHENVLLLGDFTGQLYCRQDRAFMANVTLSVNHPVTCLLDYTPDSSIMPDVLGADTVSAEERTVTLIPRSQAARPQDLMVLKHLIETIDTGLLRRLLHSIFSCPRIYESFITAPASLKHHHSQAGGLLRHSLEVAQLMGMQPGLTAFNRDLGVAAGLLHDIGKIRTLTPGKRTSTGHLVDHENLNLEVLAPWLSRLDEMDMNLSNHLRHALTTKHPNSHYPQSFIKEMLKLSDQMSVVRDRKESAFRHCPTWQKHKRVSENESWVRN